jgi:hypothetical protein
MGYKSGADGVAKRGKTQVDVMANYGKDVTPKTEGKGGRMSNLNKAMKAVGRNMARANNQKRGG